MIYKNKNAVNLGIIFLIIFVLGCSCSKLIGNLAESVPSPTPSPAPRANSVSLPESTPSTDSSYLTMANFNKLKIGMVRSEVESILGGKGNTISDTTGGGVRFSVNKWEGANYKSIILSFRNDKIMTKSQVGLK